MTFTPEEIDDIAAHLTATGEIDTRYSYMGDSAAAWDRFASRLADDAQPNILHSTLDLLSDAHTDLVGALDGPVRVVDLGPGNALPVRGLLERLLAEERLERYVAVDASAAMLSIASANLRSWLGPAARLEFACRDFTADSLGDLRGPATLVLLAGATLLNFTDPAAVLRHTRQVADVVAFTVRVDNVANRSRFRLAEHDGIPDDYRVMLENLGVPRDRYVPEFGYDPAAGERYLRIHVTAPVVVAGRVPLAPGSSVQLWRYRHLSAEELDAVLTGAGYRPLTRRISPDGEILLLGGVVNADRLRRI